MRIALLGQPDSKARTIRCLALLALLAAACNFPGGNPAVFQPAESSPEARALPGGQPAVTVQPGSEIAPGSEDGNISAPRPTSQAEPSLVQGLPSFPGMYWTRELLVEEFSQGVRIVSAMPCSQLSAMLGSGEWRLAGQAVPAASTTATPAMFWLEWGDRAALVQAVDLGTRVDSAAPQSGESTPAPSPPAMESQAAGLGCSATLELLHIQPVSAAGEFNGAGQAWAYPIPMGCIDMGDTISVQLIYEGPGDLRTMLTFSAPKSLGERSLEGDNLSLEMMRSEESLLDFFTRVYAPGETGDDGENNPWTELYPMADEMGSVSITGLDPIEGEVNLVGWSSEETGIEQSLRAGFRCEIVDNGAE